MSIARKQERGGHAADAAAPNSDVQLTNGRHPPAAMRSASPDELARPKVAAAKAQP
jgi:hypothetical protein